MKVITIGRDRTQDICYDNEMISRRHAILRIYNNGKMEIVSLGQNGTFVNGNLCKPNAHYPLKRNDVVSFAHVCELDWSEIPNPLKWVKITSLTIGVFAVIAVVLALTYDHLPFLKKDMAEDDMEYEMSNETPENTPNDWGNTLPDKGDFSQSIPGVDEGEPVVPETAEEDQFKKYFKDKNNNKKQEKQEKQEKPEEKKDSATAIGNILI